MVSSTKSSSLLFNLESLALRSKSAESYPLPNTVQNGRRVLEGVTGEIKAGRLTAIMGPSGAGKTTFMSVLAGKAHYGKVVGDVFINGVDVAFSTY